MNVKALTVACALGMGLFYFIYVAFVLMVPVDYQAGLAGAGVWLPVFRSVTAAGFLVGFIQAVTFGALIGLVIGGIHNFFHNRWAEAH